MAKRSPKKKAGQKAESIDLDALRERHRELERQKIEAAANLKNATKRLKELASEAKKKFGTDDLEELREKLAEMTSENDRKLAEYNKHLSSIEGDLKKIETKAQKSGDGK